jgi:hypothetical protein
MAQAFADFAAKIFKAFDRRVSQGLAKYARKTGSREETLRKLIAVAIMFLTLMFLTLTSAMAAGKPQTFTGEVSDSMCGAKHMMEGNAACTRACVRKGSNYALVVGDKVYALHADAKADLDALDKLAGEKAKITGVADGETIEVSKVATAQ